MLGLNLLDPLFIAMVCNLFWIGMDGQVVYGFHHVRDEKSYLAQGPVANKVPKEIL